MLILSRKENESIHIGDDIVVVVTRIGRNRVQIGIDAPREMRIRRSELADAPSETSPSQSTSKGSSVPPVHNAVSIQNELAGLSFPLAER
ncbi:hypothetical protein CA13_47720 [Planctomycetes bacterium CA13]|uniref:Translational regulator CsrA n=1 Tax=Novipirellula herctigrandis TaxID=2527986 RepID=A0A5C5Z881_9BACT|nr:hypothetical protein CA13_47720 [Planctomycetes bacterium CA13]